MWQLYYEGMPESGIVGANTVRFRLPRSSAAAAHRISPNSTARWTLIAFSVT